NAARCALELAILDAFGRRLRQPVSSLTQQIAPELFEPKPQVRYSGAITSATGFKLRLSCWKMWIYGFRQLKVKVGIAGQDDVKRLKVIRRLAGRKMDLRIDANEAWTPANVVERIAQLAEFGITSVEQPVPHADVDCLAHVRRRISVPIMHDESLC